MFKMGIENLKDMGNGQLLVGDLWSDCELWSHSSQSHSRDNLKLETPTFLLKNIFHFFSPCQKHLHNAKSPT